VLFWELGNELNLAWDGCCYDKSDGAYFSSQEGLDFLHTFAQLVKSTDPYHRPVSSGISMPRRRATALAADPQGGRACVTAANPHGDCELCWGKAADSEAETRALITEYGQSTDIL